MNILWQNIKNILYFPIWWYTEGAFKILKKISREIKEFAHSLNLGILFKYLFKPMYGLTDVWSRIISFMVRIVHFCILGSLALIWILVLIIFFLAWLALPIFIVYNILYQLNIV
jgi:hypothetical protein